MSVTRVVCLGNVTPSIDKRQCLTDSLMCYSGGTWQIKLYYIYSLTQLSLNFNEGDNWKCGVLYSGTAYATGTHCGTKPCTTIILIP